jgi:hypothetical protein
MNLAHPSVGSGFEINTGAFAVRRRAAGLLVEWLNVFMSDYQRMRYFLTGEQQGKLC